MDAAWVAATTAACLLAAWAAARLASGKGVLGFGKDLMDLRRIPSPPIRSWLTGHLPYLLRPDYHVQVRRGGGVAGGGGMERVVGGAWQRGLCGSEGSAGREPAAAISMDACGDRT